MNTDIEPKERQILVVEDDYFIAEEVAGHLARHGVNVVGPVGNILEAMDAIKLTSLDAAVVDINLHGEMAFPVADALMARNIPFVFATGYDKTAIPARYSTIARCAKPVDYRNLTKLLRM